MNRVVRQAIQQFDARYAMYVSIYEGTTADHWDALAAALLAYPQIR